jgi:hypothetical protein
MKRDISRLQKTVSSSKEGYIVSIPSVRKTATKRVKKASSGNAIALLDETKPEKEVVQEVDDLLNLCKIFHWRNNSGGSTIAQQVYEDKSKTKKVWKHYHVKFGKEGSSDFLGECDDGRFLAIECKRPVGGVTSDLQKKFLDEINRRGGVGIVVTSAADCLAQLKEAGVIK